MEKKDLIANATQTKSDEELIAKAKQANSVEELMALAKENGYPMDEKEAEFYFEKLHKTGELSDDTQAASLCSIRIFLRLWRVFTHTECTLGI